MLSHQEFFKFQQSILHEHEYHWHVTFWRPTLTGDPEDELGGFHWPILVFLLWYKQGGVVEGGGVTSGGYTPIQTQIHSVSLDKKKINELKIS